MRARWRRQRQGETSVDTGASQGTRDAASAERVARVEPAAGDGAPAGVTLIGKPGCHLCDAARAVIEKVTAEFGVPWRELDIAESAELRERYWDQIPVTLVNGRPHDFWKVDETRLRAALRAAAR